LNDHDLKKQISSITKYDAEITTSQQDNSQGLKNLFFNDQNIYDPDKPEFWEEVVLVDPEFLKYLKR
jgi:hypothetical protein